MGCGCATTFALVGHAARALVPFRVLVLRPRHSQRHGGIIRDLEVSGWATRNRKI